MSNSRRRSLLVDNTIPLTASIVAKTDVIAGDICAYDKTSSQKVFLRLWTGSEISAGNYEPIGVVVIPASHNTTSNVTIVSLAEMDYVSGTTNGNVGINSEFILWGDPVNVSLDVYDTVVVSDSPRDNAISNYPAEGWLPTTDSRALSVGYECYDGVARYFYGYGLYCPSPYTPSGAVNSGYVSNDFSCLSDLSGQFNTYTIDASRDDLHIYPAVASCYKYKTAGTSLGDWYLPSCGEFGYLIARLQEIKDAMSYIMDYFPDTLCKNISDEVHWTSTRTTSEVRVIHVPYGEVGIEAGDSQAIVRAFLLV